MPHKAIACRDTVFDAFVYESYRAAGTNRAELNRRLELVYKIMKNELTDNEFAVLKEYYIDGRKMKEIAALRGVNPSTITRQIKNARNKVINIAKYY